MKEDLDISRNNIILLTEENNELKRQIGITGRLLEKADEVRRNFLFITSISAKLIINNFNYIYEKFFSFKISRTLFGEKKKNNNNNLSRFIS